MKDLHFNVEGQRITRSNIDDFKGIIMRSKGYLRCLFSFDDEWAGTKKVAAFSNERNEAIQDIFNSSKTAEIKHVSCMVPDEVTDKRIIYLKIFGIKNGLKLETNWIMIEQEV